MSFCASIRLLSVVALAAAWAPKPRFATPSSSRTPRSRPLGFARGERVRARCSPSRRLSPLRAVPVNDLCYTAWEWCANLGAPAALVGGGAAASYDEMRDRGALEPRVGDARAVVAVKKLVFLLLLSSFALSLANVFVTTVMGTVLMTNADRGALAVTGAAAGGGAARSGLGVFRGAYELEFLFARISFLQGLLHWIGAIALELGCIPKAGESRVARRLSQAAAAGSRPSSSPCAVLQRARRVPRRLRLDACALRRAARAARPLRRPPVPPDAAVVPFAATVVRRGRVPDARGGAWCTPRRNAPVGLTRRPAAAAARRRGGGVHAGATTGRWGECALAGARPRRGAR